MNKDLSFAKILKSTKITSIKVIIDEDNSQVGYLLPPKLTDEHNYYSTFWWGTVQFITFEGIDEDSCDLDEVVIMYDFLDKFEHKKPTLSALWINYLLLFNTLQESIELLLKENKLIYPKEIEEYIKNNCGDLINFYNERMAQVILDFYSLLEDKTYYIVKINE